MKTIECECALGREKRIYKKKLTCLLKEEILQLEQMQGKSFDMLYEESNCKDDVCLFNYLNNDKKINNRFKVDVTGSLITGGKRFGKNNKKLKNINMSGGNNQLQQIFQNAIPPETSIQEGGWLDSHIIDKICKQIQNNSKTKYLWKGVKLYDDFEDDGNGSLNINEISKIKDGEIFGYVINTCHKYSPGQHWVSMGIIRQKNKIEVLYYDSQNINGPLSGILTCKNNPDTPQKYQQYKSRFYEWYQKLNNQLQSQGLELITYPKPRHNDFIGQDDDYSCGYHAIIFQLLLSDGEKKFSIIHDIAEANSSKNLDQFMQQFQLRVVRRVQ